jgi:hypothetical protein
MEYEIHKGPDGKLYTETSTKPEVDIPAIRQDVWKHITGQHPWHVDKNMPPPQEELDDDHMWIPSELV